MGEVESQVEGKAGHEEHRNTGSGMGKLKGHVEGKAGVDACRHAEAEGRGQQAAHSVPAARRGGTPMRGCGARG